MQTDVVAAKQKAIAKSAAWRLLNPERVVAQNARWYAENRERQAAYGAAWYAANKENALSVNSAYRKANEDRIASLKAAKRGRGGKAPAWADIELMTDIYTYARLMRAAGVECQVDHMVPQKGKSVSGLHTHENLTVMAAKDNVRKGNTWVA